MRTITSIRLLSVLLTIMLLAGQPVSAASPAPIQTISANSNNSVVILKDGTVVVWGSSNYGQLGMGYPIGTNTIYPPVKTPLTNARFVSAGFGKTLVVTNDNSLYAAGSSARGETIGAIYAPTVFTKIMDDVSIAEAGDMHIFVIKTDGSLWGWGAPDFGVLADGNSYDTAKTRTTPLKIMDDVTDIFADGGTAYAIKKDGTLWGWGYNSQGQLGVKPPANKTAGDSPDELYAVFKPRKIMDNVIAVAGGIDHTLAVTKNGDLYAFGSNQYGQLGDGNYGGTLDVFNEGIDSYDPIMIMSGIKDVGASGYLSAALTTDGKLYLWGLTAYSNDPPRLINGMSQSSDPTLVMTDVEEFSASGHEILAVKSDGSLYAWGTVTGGNEPKKIFDNIMG